MEVTAVTVAIAPREWAKRSVHFYSAEVARALSCPRYCFLAFPDEIFRRTGHHLSAQLFIIFVRVSVPSVHMGGRFVSRVDFDQYAGQYEAILAEQTNFFDGDSGYFARYKIELAQQLAGPVGSVLDFGCGIGRSMPYLREVFPKAEIVGCDPSAESLAIARRDNPTCRFMSMDELGSEAKFDLVIASCVFHHIPPQDRQMAIRYCYSRLKQGGHFIVFEHNPRGTWSKLSMRRRRGAADMREPIERMRTAHLHIDESSYCLFFPQQFAALRPFEKYLRWLPMGGQYFVCASNQKRDAA
jgi:SAM-dependent methyltransferase